MCFSSFLYDMNSGLSKLPRLKKARMKTNSTTLLLLFLAASAGLFALSCSHAPRKGVQGDVAHFVTTYVAAFNAKDIPKLNSLLHPKSLACVTPANKNYYDQALALHIRDPIPSKYSFKTMPVEDKELQSMESYARFPVRPALRLQLEYDEGEDSGTLLLWLVQEKDRWYQDDPCATEQMLKQFRDDEPARKARIAKTLALVADIKEPLRSELKAMLRDHKTVTATKRYENASGQDYENSMMVIYELTPEARRGN